MATARGSPTRLRHRPLTNKDRAFVASVIPLAPGVGSLLRPARGKSGPVNEIVIISPCPVVPSATGYGRRDDLPDILPLSVRELLSHRDLSTTEGYLHLTIADLR